MERNLKVIDYEQFVLNSIEEDHRIDDHIFLMDEYQMYPINDYSFVAPKNIFIEVLKGRGYVIVNGTKHIVKGHCLIAYLKGQDVTVKISSKKTLQRGVAFTDDFMEDMYLSALKFNDIRSSIILNPVIHLEEEQVYGLEVYVSVMRTIAAKADNPNKLMCAKLATLALFYGPLFNVLKKKMDAETSRSPSLSSRFFTLLEKNFMTEQRLGFYADALNISKTYLYDCVSSTSGKAPSYWIDYYMVSYAKKSLANMDLSILQIALSLNFAGLPQFAKFFKKQTGMSPRDYRKSLL